MPTPHQGRKADVTRNVAQQLSGKPAEAHTDQRHRHFRRRKRDLPIRHLTLRGNPRIPRRPTPQKTSSPSDIATRTTLKKARRSRAAAAA